MKNKFLLSTVFLLTAFSFCYAFDWKALHEQADSIAVEAAAKRVEENPGSPDRLYVLGLVYLNLHKDKEALAVFDKILALQSQVIEARWGMAEALRRMHKIEESSRILEEIIKARPDFSPAYITLAYIKYIRMDFNGAVQLAYTVIKQGRGNSDLSNYTRAYLIFAGSKGMIAHYGGPLSKLINGTAVLVNLKKAEKLQPGSAGVEFGLGSFYFLAPGIAGGDIERAEEYLKKAIEADPLFADAYVRLAQLCRLKKDEKKYEFYLNKAFQIDPGNELALDTKNGRCRFICAP